MNIPPSSQPAAFALTKALQQPQLLVDLLRQSVASGTTLPSPAPPLSFQGNATKGTRLDIVV